MFCSACGHQIAAIGEPCPGCGAIILAGPSESSAEGNISQPFVEASPASPTQKALGEQLHSEPIRRAPALSRKPKQVFAVFVAAVVIMGVIAFQMTSGGNHSSGDWKVIFSLSPSAGCQNSKTISTATSSQPVYFLAQISDTLGATDVVNESVAKDGVVLRVDPMTRSSNSVACIVNNLGTLSVGKYTVTMTLGNKTEATGSITITP
jgi:hypothetical protein